MGGWRPPRFSNLRSPATGRADLHTGIKAVGSPAAADSGELWKFFCVRGYTWGEGGAGSVSSSEVCLQQGERFTCGRASAIGGHAVASRSSRPAKSTGCCQLRASPRLVFSLRFSSAAPVFRSNLRRLLGGISASGGPWVRPLRRRAGRIWGVDGPRVVPGVPLGAAAVCARGGVRAVRRRDEGGDPRPQV